MIVFYYFFRRIIAGLRAKSHQALPLYEESVKLPAISVNFDCFRISNLCLPADQVFFFPSFVFWDIIPLSKLGYKSWATGFILFIFGNFPSTMISHLSTNTSSGCIRAPPRIWRPSVIYANTYYSMADTVECLSSWLVEKWFCPGWVQNFCSSHFLVIGFCQSHLFVYSTRGFYWQSCYQSG